MPLYRRKLIIEKIAERLEAIQKVNGYETDAGRHLFHGPVNLGPDDPQLAIAILPGPTDPDVQTKQFKTILLPVELHAVVKDDLDEPLLMVESIIGDIKRAVESPEAQDANLGGLASNLDAGPEIPLPRPEGSTTVGVSVEYRVFYTETWGDPVA